MNITFNIDTLISLFMAFAVILGASFVWTIRVVFIALFDKKIKNENNIHEVKHKEIL